MQVHPSAGDYAEDNAEDNAQTRPSGRRRSSVTETAVLTKLPLQMVLSVAGWAALLVALSTVLFALYYREVLPRIHVVERGIYKRDLWANFLLNTALVWGPVGVFVMPLAFAYGIVGKATFTRNFLLVLGLGFGAYAFQKLPAVFVHIQGFAAGLVANAATYLTWAWQPLFSPRNCRQRLLSFGLW